MMKDKLFDDFIREKINNRVAAVPAGIWENILQEKKKEKEKLFWWKTLTVLFIVSLSAILYTQNFSGKNDPNVQSTTAVETSSKTANRATASNHNIQNHPNQKIDLQLQNMQQNKVAANETGIVQKELNNTEKEAKNNQSILTHSFLTNRNGFKRRYQQNINKLLSSSKPASYFLNSTANQSLLTENVIADGATVPQSPYYDRYQLMLFNKKDKIFNAYHESMQTKVSPSLFSSVDCPGDGRKGNHGLYAEFYFSPDVAFKQMEYRKNGSGVIPKDSNTTRQISFSTGFRLAKEIGHNMVIRTGLHYAQINERFDYRNESERTTSTVITIRTITNSNGTTTTVRDTSIVEQIGYRVKTSYNYYKTWDIPLILGYELAGEGWKANINAGPVFNLSSKQSGDFLDSSYRPASFAKKGPAIFKSKLGISLYGSVSLIKELSNVTSLFAEPYLRYSLSDRTTDVSPFTQRFHTAGVLLGIRFKLN